MITEFFAITSLIAAASATCGSTSASDASYVILAVGADRGPLTSILNEARDEGVVGLAMDSPKDQCDSDCLFTLEHYEPPHKYSSLVVREELNEFIPFGYNKITNRSTVYCARAEGSCGATVPVWRHFFLNGSGIYHTYTLDDSLEEGYTREATPLCFVWPETVMDDEGSGEIEALLAGEERPRRDTPATVAKTCGTTFVSRKKLEEFGEYMNNLSGSEQDHLYTTKNSKELKGYNKTKDLGLILPSTDSSCSCLITLVQTLDNQTGIFHRIDHKLMREDAELNRIFEKYNVTGEKLYCASKKGQCGATIPLYKHFDFIDMDSIITTYDKEVPPSSYRYPLETLCWIWNVSYAPEEGTTARPAMTTTVKRTTRWNDWTTDDDWMNTTTRRPPTTTTRPTTVTTTTTVKPTTTTTVPTTTFKSTTRLSSNSTTPFPTKPSMALEDIIIRMVRSALGDTDNWREMTKTKLREISDKI